MNTYIDILQDYIVNRKEPNTSDSFAKDCKKVYDDHKAELETILMNLGYCDERSLRGIVGKILEKQQNYGRVVAAFVFAVVAKIKYNKLTNENIINIFRHYQDLFVDSSLGYMTYFRVGFWVIAAAGAIIFTLK